MMTEKDEGKLVAGAAAHTVTQLVDDLLRTNVARKARSTRETYTVHAEKHIKPRLGSVRLDKLTARSWTHRRTSSDWMTPVCHLP